MRSRSALRPVSLVTLALLALALPVGARAQDEEPVLWSGTEGVGQALGRLFEKCDAAMAEGYLGYASGTMCLAVARVLPGPTATIEFSAEGGVSYTLLAAGDDNAAGAVTVEVTDSEGNVIARDPEGAEGSVQFAGDDLLQVTIGVSIPYSEDGPAAYCAIALLCSGGESVSSDGFAEPFAKLVATLGAAEAELGSELRAHGNDNFAIYGAVLPPNQGGVAQGVTLEPGPHILLSAGDANATQVTCDFSDGGVESYGYSGDMEDVAVVAYAPEEMTRVAPMAGRSSEERNVLLWILVDGPGE